MAGVVAADNKKWHDAHTMKVWNLRSVLGHRADSRTIRNFGDHATGMANARPPLRSHV